MKRYWVFACDRFWPHGGDDDLYWTTDSKQEAEWVRYNLNQFQERWVVDTQKDGVPPENEDLVRRLFDDLAEGREPPKQRGGRRVPLRERP